MEDKKKRKEAKFEMIVGNFCNCFFQDEDSVPNSASYHVTEIEGEDACCWCGHHVIFSVKKCKIKKVDIDSIKYRDATRYVGEDRVKLVLC